MPTPVDKDLYKYVKILASRKFKSPSGIYRLLIILVKSI